MGLLVASLAARHILPGWRWFAILGILEVTLGVLALADPGTTLAALVMAGGTWAVAVGAMRVVASFEVKRLPDYVDGAWASNGNGSVARAAQAETRGTARELVMPGRPPTNGSTRRTVPPNQL